jgi:hypothetical protein
MWQPTKQNMAPGWIPKMTNASVKHSGAWHIALVAPIKLVGVLDLRIELGAFLDIPLKVDAPIQLGMVYVNTNDCGKHTLHCASPC